MSVPSASLQPYVRQADEHQRLAYTGAAEQAGVTLLGPPHGLDD